MLRSTLSSVKPSSLDDIDLSAKSSGTTTISRTTTKVARNMIAPLPSASAFTSAVESRTTLSNPTHQKPDPTRSPLDDLFQIIHLSPPAIAGPCSSTSGSSYRGRPVESFSLHTVIDETGKWVKLRLYALVEVPLGPAILPLKEEKEEEEGGIVRGKRRRMETRVSETTTKTIITPRTTMRVSKEVKLEEEEEQSETEDENDPDPIDEHKANGDTEPNDRRCSGSGKDVKVHGQMQLGVGVWKGYLRLSKVEHPHTPTTIAKSISEGLLHVIRGDAGLGGSVGAEVDGGVERGMTTGQVVMEGDGEVKLIVSFPSDLARDSKCIKPLIIPCQSARGNGGGDCEAQTGQLVMEETLRGWWDVGCKIIAKHNIVSKELWTMQDRRTRPLPSCSAALGTQASASQVPSSSQSGARPGSQDRPGMEGRKGSGVKTDPNYEDYLALVREVQALRVENRQLSQENSALKGGYAGKLSLSQQARGGPGSQAMGARQIPPGMSKIQPGIRRPPKIESGFASSSDDD